MHLLMPHDGASIKPGEAIDLRRIKNKLGGVVQKDLSFLDKAEALVFYKVLFDA